MKINRTYKFVLECNRIMCCCRWFVAEEAVTGEKVTFCDAEVIPKKSVASLLSQGGDVEKGCQGNGWRSLVHTNLLLLADPGKLDWDGASILYIIIHALLFYWFIFLHISVGLSSY